MLTTISTISTIVLFIGTQFNPVLINTEDGLIKGINEMKINCEVEGLHKNISKGTFLVGDLMVAFRNEDIKSIDEASKLSITK